MTIDSKAYAFQSSLRSKFMKFLFEIVFFLYGNRLESLRLSIVIEMRVYKISTRNCIFLLIVVERRVYEISTRNCIFLAWQRKNILEDRYLYEFIYVNVYRHDPHPCKLVPIPFIRRVILSYLIIFIPIESFRDLHSLISGDKGEYSKNFRI